MLYRIQLINGWRKEVFVNVLAAHFKCNLNDLLVFNIKDWSQTGTCVEGSQWPEASFD